jgi:hypothetical protein
MRRGWVLLAVLTMGCGGHAPTGPAFTSEREESAYLESLSNPTPEQWKRREALRAKRKAQEDAINAPEKEANYRKFLLEQADMDIKRDPAMAAKGYRYLIEGYPGTPEAKEAEGRLKELRQAPTPK